MKMHEILESASAGATSAGAVASIANPPTKKKKKRSSAYNPDGTMKNALDTDTNVVGGKTVKR
jgi:hypothetical protein